MATVDEILETMSEVAVSTDEMLVIDPNTRQISVPGSELVFGVESDTNSERKYFLCPRYVGNGVDLATCFLRVNFRNANGEIDAYLVDDVEVSGDNITFSWVLSRKVTLYKGQVVFVICATHPGGTGTKMVEWNTTLTNGVVLEGLEPDQDIIENNTKDVVTELLDMMNVQKSTILDTGAGEIERVQMAGDTQVANVNTAAKAAETASVNEIEAKGVNTLDSIPDDYTALSEAVEGLTRATAPGIVCEASGTSVYVEDASDQAVRGLRLFGKSTQDGVPTPDAPVEIVSVESPVVTVCGKNRCSGQEYGVIFPCRLTENITYTVSVDNSVSDAMCLLVYDKNQERFQSVKCTSDNGKRRYANITPSKDVYYAMWAWANTSSVVKGQVEVGATATSYEPYSGQRVELPHTLPGIPVTSGGNYTDSDGQSWVCDEVDLERGVYVQRVGSLSFTGEESWSKSQYYENTVQKSRSGLASGSTYLCNMYAETTLNVNHGVVIGGAINIRDDVHAVDVETWKNHLRELHSSGNPVVIIGALTDPIETPLSETEIAAYRALHSNYPNTTVLNDSGAHMVVKYTADTKRYIDNKITALVGGA